MRISPIQQKIIDLEKRGAILDKIVKVSKSSGGRITKDGKDLIYILRNAGLNKSEIAKILDVTPAALTPYE